MAYVCAVNNRLRWALALALVGAALGLVMAGQSTMDYVAHLDRQLHDVHCSFVPGAGADPSADNACKAAMYSPYSALLRDRVWGGVPISLFGVGAFSFLVAFVVYLLASGSRAPRRGYQFLGLAGPTPLVASGVMAAISVMKLGSFCKTCVGIYIGSAILAAGAFAAWWIDRKAAKERALGAVPRAGSNVPPTVIDEPSADGPAFVPRPLGAAALIFTWLGGMGVFALAPGLIYLESVPSYAEQVTGCGKLDKQDDPQKALIHITPSGAVQPVTMMVDPLCATCKAFHQRLESDGVLARLDISLVLFPLDSECNWNLTTPMHPGACIVAKAVLCLEDRVLPALEWAYAEQDALLASARSKDGEAQVKAMIDARWQGLDACMTSKQTRLRLDEMIRFAVVNKLPVSTPQLFVGDQRLCEEDSDIGLPYALGKLSPALAKK